MATESAPLLAVPLKPRPPAAVVALGLLFSLLGRGYAGEPLPTLDRGIVALGDEPRADREIVFSSATTLARRIRAHELTSVQVVEAFIRQIRAENERWNAVVLLDGPGALRRAAEADTALARGEVWGPLHGVPVTVKDRYSTAGLRSTAGHIPLAEYLPTEDATAVALLRDAGAIILAKTNLARLAMDMQTTNRIGSGASWPDSRFHMPGC